MNRKKAREMTKKKKKMMEEIDIFETKMNNKMFNNRNNSKRLR